MMTIWSSTMLPSDCQGRLFHWQQVLQCNTQYKQWLTHWGTWEWVALFSASVEPSQLCLGNPGLCLSYNDENLCFWVLLPQVLIQYSVILPLCEGRWHTQKAGFLRPCPGVWGCVWDLWNHQGRKNSVTAGPIMPWQGVALKGLRKLGSLQCGKLTAQAMYRFISTLQTREGTFVPSSNGVTQIFVSIWPQLGQNWQVAYTSSGNAGVCKI